MEIESQRRRVIAVVNDLFFSAKINEAAKHAGVQVEYVTQSGQLAEKLRADLPGLVIVDLNFAAVDPVGLIRQLKAQPESSAVRVIGYLSHVQVDLKAQAQQAGCDLVVPRSAFSANLAEILRS